MSRKANPTTIGGFVVGAIVLAVVGIVWLGGGQFFSKTVKFVLYFDGSLKGLNVGGPVLFRGVRIGTVTDVVVRSYPEEERVEIPVYIELEQGRVERHGERRSDPEAAIAHLIEDRGLRAQLEMQSFVTGILAIQLDFHPDTPITMRADHSRYPEIPTIPSTMEEVMDKLESLPIRALFEDAREAVQGINALVRSEELKETIRSVDATVDEFGELAKHVDEKIDPLATAIDDTAGSARQTLDQARESIASVEDTLNKTLEDARKLVRDVDGQIDPVVSSFIDTGETAQAALQQARDTLAVARSAISEDSELYFRLNNTLAELSAASRSIRILAEFLEQHPEALLQGKGGPPGGR
jgi:paraquat-inducible protein B